MTCKEKPVILEEKLKKPRVIVISGPTAIGKSSLAIEIAKIINAEIISCDSMQIYKKMDIGTAKIKDYQGVVHHLIDVCDLKDSFTVMDYYKKAMKALKTIFIKKKIPIIVGGCGFYLHALLYGPPQGPSPDFNFREKMEKEIREKGIESLYEMLQMLDPLYAKTITEHDWQKIIRGLEIIYLTKKQISSFALEKKSEFDFRCWFLYEEKEKLYAKVEKRCEKMLEEGLVEEVQELREDLLKNYSAKKSIGYRQCLDYLDQKYTKEQFLQEFKKASRHYVKRQFTWFKKEKYFRWLNVNISKEKVIEFILQDYEQG